MIAGIVAAQRVAEAAAYDGDKIFLAHFDGADGSGTFVDEAGHTINKYSTPTISTAQSKFGGASFGSDRTKGLYTGYENDFKLSGVWTIDFWWRPSSLGGVTQHPVILTSADQSQVLMFALSPPSPLFVTVNASASSVGMTAVATVAVDTWQHIELGQDEAGTVRLFIDGVLQDTETEVDAAYTKAQRLCIGYANEIWGVGYGFSGHVDELCIRAGFAHTDNFTPPAAPYSYP